MQNILSNDDQPTLTGEDYRALVLSFAPLTWEADPEGRFVADAPACRSFTGQERESWLDRGWLAAVHPDDRPRIERDWRRALADQAPLTAPLRLRHRQGHYRAVTVHATPVRKPGGSVGKWVGMLVEREPEHPSPAPGAQKKSAPEIVNAPGQHPTDPKTLLQAILDTAPVAITAYQPVYADGRVRDFRFLFVNAFGQKLAGEDATGQLLSQAFPTTLTNTAFDRLRAALEQGSRQDMEIWYAGEGMQRWFRTVAVPMEGIVLATTEDVTDRKATEQSLQEKSGLLQAIIDAPDIGIAVYKAVRNEAGEIEDFVHEYINRASVTMLGEDFTGKLLSDHGDNGTTQLTRFVDVIETGRGNDYVRNVPFRGRDVWFSVTNRPLGHDRLVHTWEDVTERQRAQEKIVQLKEEAAQTATDRYHYIFNSIEEGFCIYEVLYDEHHRPCDLRWTDVNPAYEKQTGLKDVVGKTHLELSFETDQSWFDTFDRVAKTGEPEYFLNFFERTERWHEISVSPTNERSAPLVGLIFKDVTDRIQTEARQNFILKLNEALRTAEEPELIEATVCDLAMTYFRADRCFYCTVREGESVIRHDAYCQGLSSVAATYPLHTFEKFNSLVERGEPFAIEDVTTSPFVDDDLREICLRDKNIALLSVPVVKQDKVVGVFSITSCTPRVWTQTEKESATDTAERIWAAVERANAESARRETEERLLAMLKNLPGGAVFVVDREMRYVLAEGEILANSEAGNAEFLNKPVSEVLRRLGLEFYEELYRRAFRGEKFMYELNTGGRTYLTRGLPLRRDESNEVYEVLVISYEITDRKRAEEALRVADQRKNEFLAMLAHELRNPMATIQSGLHILHELQDEPGGLPRPTLDMMTRQTDHLVRLVDDLLDVSRISRGQIELRKQPVDLVAVVEEAVASARTLYFKRGKQLSADLPDFPVPLRGDATRLGQVVTNLLNNGIRYTSDAGEVWLSLTVREGDPTTREAVLEVRDNGIGMTQEQLTSIFELFVQHDTSPGRAAGGLGVGLTLVQRLVEGHGGTVDVHSDGLGKGSTFTVVLPVPDVQLGASGTPHGLPAGTSERILIIDDNADAAKTLATLLQLRGYDVLTAPDGHTGISAAATHRPRTILLDIGMPDLDGYETCRRLRRQPWARDTRIVAVSGYGQESDRRRAREAGFDAHLVKPVKISTLADLLGASSQKS